MTTTIASPPAAASAAGAREVFLRAGGASPTGRERPGSTLGGLATCGAGAMRGAAGFRRTAGGDASTLAAWRSRAGDSRGALRGGLATGAPSAFPAHGATTAGLGVDVVASEGRAGLGA